MATKPAPPVALFGYHSSAFTKKIRMVLKLRQIPYTFVIYPSMMPRPILTSAFALTYRKTPVLAIGRDVYCDTSLISETLNTHPALPAPFFPDHPTIHPLDSSSRSTKTLSRLLASHYTDRPWFRIMTGLVPGEVWHSQFGTDRAGLIGHRIDANKLQRKIPQNLASLERDLSILEPHFAELGVDGSPPWLLHTSTPSYADISLYFMLDWGRDIASGIGVEDLTAGGCPDLQLEGMSKVFNESRYPGVWRWFMNYKDYFGKLKDVEKQRIEQNDEAGPDEVIRSLQSWGSDTDHIPMLQTPQPWNEELDAQSGIVVGAELSVAPDDTGRDDPVLGTLLQASAQEVVIRPSQTEHKPQLEGVRVHFPRVGFVVKPVSQQNKL